MKVIFPQNIQKGFLSGLGLSILGFNISLIQMFLMAIGVVAALGTFSSLSKSGAKTLGLVMAVIIFLIFLVITFFKVSELNLPAFIAKKIRDVFLDTPKKFQINHKKNSPTDILVGKSRSQEGKQKIELKTALDRSKISQLEKKGLI